jgi:hypothetical protein
MRAYMWLVSICLLAAMSPGIADAEDFALALTLGPGFPVGDLAEKTDIVEPGESGAYDATGGGAETGLGFKVELEAQLTSRVFVGGTFGYNRHSADAGDVLEKIIEPLVPAVTGIDAEWKMTLIGGFVRVSAWDSQPWRVYARGGLGAAKIKNAFDVTFDVPSGGSQTMTSDFDLGNRFYLDGALGVEYVLGEKLSVVTELGLRHFFSDGAGAAARAGEYELAGTQRFDAQVFQLMFGVRIPLEGM